MLKDMYNKKLLQDQKKLKQELKSTKQDKHGTLHWTIVKIKEVLKHFLQFGTVMLNDKQAQEVLTTMALVWPAHE
ncbi:hypothetical protein GGF31_005190 [Allomyces arbusculus]|nr:hypothetical protein GGF31_005190 [Allomyces arbusculus]